MKRTPTLAALVLTLTLMVGVMLSPATSMRASRLGSRPIARLTHSLRKAR